MYRYRFSCVILIMALCLSAQVRADTIEAMVTHVTGSDLELTLADSSRQPEPGDSVNISFPKPGGGRISIGIWSVTSVKGQKVYVSVVHSTAQPMVGYLASIQTSQPNASTVSAPPASHAPEAAGHTPPGTAGQMTAEEQRLLSELRSANAADKRRAARTIHRSYLGNKILQEAVADELLKGYAIRARDRNYIDAMAWMCNVLGDSGDRKYSETLRQVYRGTRNRKIKKFAKINYQKVR